VVGVLAHPLSPFPFHCAPIVVSPLVRACLHWWWWWWCCCRCCGARRAVSW
jgi:hypothetical protein